LQKKDDLQKQKAAQEEFAAQKTRELHIKARTVGNYVHETAPEGLNEDDNKVTGSWAPEGFDKDLKQKLSHHEVLWRLNGYDPTRGVKLVGHRGYCLTGYGLFLYDSKSPRATSNDTKHSQKYGLGQLRARIPLLKRLLPLRRPTS
jgi:seryl-tRNA synthetase